MEKEKKILRRIFEEREIFIEATRGSEIIPPATEIFCHINQNFKDWELNKRSPDTLKTPVVVYEMVGSGNFQQIFDELFLTGKLPLLTQSQIKEFCLKHHDLLQPEFQTFFFFEKEKSLLKKLLEQLRKLWFKEELVKGRYFVANIHVRPSGRYIRANRLDDDYRWRGDSHHRVISPAPGV
jgi:hypothetical protein